MKKLIFRIVNLTVDPFGTPASPSKEGAGRRINPYPENSVDLVPAFVWAMRNMRVEAIYQNPTGKGRPATNVVFVDEPASGTLPNATVTAITEALARLNGVNTWDNPDGSVSFVGATPNDGSRKTGRLSLSVYRRGGKFHIECDEKKTDE